MPLDLSPAMPEVFLAVSALVLLVVGVFRDDDAGSLLTALCALMPIVAVPMVLAQGDATITTFGGHFVFDAYAAFLKVVILLGASLSIVLGAGFMRDAKIDRFEYPLLALFAALGMCMMVSANSLLALYMALELQSLTLYVMAAIDRDSLRSTEAGLKYFVLGALASGLLLYGCSLVYGFTGTIMFGELAARLAPNAEVTTLPIGVLVGLVFIVSGLAFKLAAVPFHMWTPDVYEGAPSSVTTFLAAAPKVAAIGLIVRFLLDPFAAWVAQWQQIVVVIALLSMLLGALAAIGQSNIKRLMAYSAIGHVGYALVGVAAGNERGVYGVLIYMVIYIAMTLGTFGCILLMRRNGRYVETIADLAGLSRHQPMLALAFAIFMFSLAGIPPLAGFFGKLYVFLAAVEAGLTWLAVVGVLTSVIGAFYYLRIVKLIYFDEPVEAFDRTPHPMPAAVVAVTALLTAGFVLLASPIVTAAQAAAQALLR